MNQVLINAEGAPASFVRRARRERVIDVYKRWRVNEDWWRQEIAREYFTVETSSGLVGVIFHDLVADCWYLARVYD
ncbi:MAG: hypothetical protein Q7R39_01465 [Dehalococcoidia bacterium]|nr:hypothetical protein [Dehalococcoidia bacterium]